MHFRKHLGAAFAVALIAAGCAQQPKLTAEELAKLKGGRTTVVVFFSCADINYLTGGKIITYTSAIKVGGAEVGKVEYCGHTRFTVESGQHEMAITNPTNVFALNGHPRPEIFRPGTTQYLNIWQGQHSQLHHRWVTKEEAEQGIKAIDDVKPVF